MEDRDDDIQVLRKALLDSLKACYERNDLTVLRSLFDEDCDFVIPQGEGRGKELLCEILAKAMSGSGDVMFRSFRIDLRNISSSIVLVRGSYKIYSGRDSSLLAAERRRVTMLCSKESSVWKVRSLHISSEREELDETSVFPVAVGKESRDYFCSILRSARYSGKLPSRVVFPTENHGEALIDPSEITVVRADGKNSMVEGDFGTISTVVSIAKVEKMLPGTFLRIGRSIVVNLARVAEIRHCALLLDDGTEVLVPRRRAKEVRSEVAVRLTVGLRV